MPGLQHVNWLPMVDVLTKTLPKGSDASEPSSRKKRKSIEIEKHNSLD